MKRLWIAILLAWVWFSTPVLAITLDQAKVQLRPAKAQGLVGERGDGYLGVVIKSPGTTELVKAINDARRAAYTRLATGNKIDLAAVEQRAGLKAIAKTPKGQMILKGGKWVPKP